MFRAVGSKETRRRKTMKRSTDRILTTHAGSLPRPEGLIDAYRTGQGRLDAAGEARLRSAVADVVREEARCGVDIVNDGEFGKPTVDETDYGAWATYVYGRLSGYEFREADQPPDVLKEILGQSKDRADFAAFYSAGLDGTNSARRRVHRFPANTGPIKYTGHAAVQRDIANFKAALQDADVADAFMSAVFTGVQIGPNEYYKTRDEQAVALAEAVREEYRAIVAAGLNVQIDDPLLVNIYEMYHSMKGDLDGYRRWAAGHVELLNHALEGIPEEKIRYHLCWGSWLGPHSTDLPMRDVIDLLVKVKASQYSFEAANPQHEHEWKAWQGGVLPEGRALIPGVVTHKTTILEHPETVADRIVRYANVVGKENVIAGTDCGFGGRIHPQLAWAKLAALAAGAELASRELW
jgi:5-methyltetrahydropteroyltriglutamate--homocysteine methyltransferase